MVLKLWYLYASFFKKQKQKNTQQVTFCNYLSDILSGFEPKAFRKMTWLPFPVKERVYCHLWEVSWHQVMEDLAHVFGSWLKREGISSHSWAWTSSCGSAESRLLTWGRGPSLPSQLPKSWAKRCPMKFPRVAWRGGMLKSHCSFSFLIPTKIFYGGRY